jgi:hypothetical protein
MMKDLEQLHDLLNDAVRSLSMAVDVVDGLELDDRKQAVKSIGNAIGAVWYALTFLPPDPRRCDEECEPGEPDPHLTAEQQAQVDLLTEDQRAAIDDALISACSFKLRKVAMVVATAMTSLGVDGIPDMYFAQRIRNLVTQCRLESVGNLEYMRHSEVRLPKSTGE